MKLWIVVYSFQGIIDSATALHSELAACQYIRNGIESLPDPAENIDRFWAAFAQWQQQQYARDGDNEYKVFVQE